MTDRAMRPWQVREHVLGTPADADRIVLQEDDERFEVTVRATAVGTVDRHRVPQPGHQRVLVASGRRTPPPPRGRLPAAAKESSTAVDHAPWGSVGRDC
ncbi:MAG: hypothetical protein V9G10_13735 [Candidatus Nanopelagicales bacterium]